MALTEQQLQQFRSQMDAQAAMSQPATGSDDTQILQTQADTQIPQIPQTPQEDAKQPAIDGATIAAVTGLEATPPPAEMPLDEGGARADAIFGTPESKEAEKVQGVARADDIFGALPQEEEAEPEEKSKLGQFLNPGGEGFMDIKTLVPESGFTKGILDAQEKIDKYTKEEGIDEIVRGGTQMTGEAAGKLREFAEFIQKIGQESVDAGTLPEQAGGQLMKLAGMMIESPSGIIEDVFKGTAAGTITDKEIYKKGAALGLEASAGKVLGAAGLAAKGLGKVGGKVAKTIFKTVKNPETIKAISKLNKAAKTAVQQADDLAGAIIQGDKAAKAKARRALGSIDTTEIKTVDDLLSKFSDKKKGLGTVRDELLNQDTTKHLIKDLGKSSKVVETGEILKKNPVDDALSALEKMNEGDIDELARIRGIRARGASEGLTRKEINDISIDYGRQVGKKAFDAKGNVKETMKGIDTEAIRKGVKEAARKFADTDELKAIDAQFSDILNTEKHLTNLSEAASKLGQKAAVRSSAEKLAGKAGELVDFLSGGTIKAFTSKFFPSNLGLKTMNTIQIEEHIAKNLKKLAKIEKLIKQGLEEGNEKAAAEALQMLRKQKVTGAAKGAAGLATTAAATKQIID